MVNKSHCKNTIYFYILFHYSPFFSLRLMVCLDFSPLRPMCAASPGLVALQFFFMAVNPGLAAERG